MIKIYQKPEPVSWRYQYAKHITTLLWLSEQRYNPELIQAWSKHESSLTPLQQAWDDFCLYMGWGDYR